MKFSPSINIERDFEKAINYIVTPNSVDVYNQILNGYKTGFHCINIIGSYGTGKSSFLLAFENQLLNKNNYFPPLNGQLNGRKKFHFVNISGKYCSIIELFGEKLRLEDNTLENILLNLKSLIIDQNNEEKVLIIIIDEFGKLLEYAAKNEPEKELYYFQQITEFLNDAEFNALLITTLHQGFSSYSQTLNRAQRNEWEKVKGRFKEIAFNEPVEQLLYIAAEFLNNAESNIPENYAKLFDLIIESKLLNIHSNLTKVLANRLYPLDILSAVYLTLALQKYGQNERSLFSFMESEEYYSVKDFKQSANLTYNLSFVYNYLLHEYYSFLTSRYNPDTLKWASISEAIRKIEIIFEEDVINSIKIVKTIGLISLFAPSGCKADKEFLAEYAKQAMQIKNAFSIIERLERNRIIKFINYRGYYIINEGTDFDIEQALQDAEMTLQRPVEILDRLRNYLDLPYIPAKAVYYQKGTPRFFEFKVNDNLKSENPENEIDGFIYLLFSSTISECEIIEYSSQLNDAVLILWFKNTDNIREQLFKIDIASSILPRVEKSDTVALREINNLLMHEKTVLNKMLQINIFRQSENLAWYFLGKKIEIKTRTDFNKLLSKVCDTIYSKAPVLKNELMNRQKLSSNISAARSVFFKHLIENFDKKDLGFDPNLFPPQKAIYLILLKNTGIHRKIRGEYILGEPEDKSFLPVWQASEKFIESCKPKSRNLDEFVKILKTKPYKLKQGLIDFWIPLFLFIKRDDFALFCQDAFVPNLNVDVIDLIQKQTSDYTIKTFDISGVKLDLFNKYREMINLEKEEKFKSSSFIETIKPFLTFYKNLPEYAKKTKRLSKSATRLREEIAKAKDPEITFFESFPAALGFKDLDLRENTDFLKDYITHLQNAIREIRSCFSELQNRIENEIITTLGLQSANFYNFYSEILNRYKHIKQHLLLPKQKSFYSRLITKSENKLIWLSSLVHDLLGKPIESIKDEEEEMIFEKIQDTFQELDNLVEIHKLKKEKEKEEIIKFDITTIDKGRQTQQIIVSGDKLKEVNDLAKSIEEIIGKDNVVNKAALIKILQKQLK